MNEIYKVKSEIAISNESFTQNLRTRLCQTIQQKVNIVNQSNKLVFL